MAKKTLIIAEKPSVGRDIAKVIAPDFDNKKNYLENDELVISWSIGHLLTLAEPARYDKKYKFWRKANLPILPEDFKITPISSKHSKEQLKVLVDLIRRDDVDTVVNACDAGREGELIFAYIYSYSKTKKPVQRLWLSSMARQAIKDSWNNLKPASDFTSLEAAARSRAESDWLVGINATQMATLQLSKLCLDTVSLGRVQTPTLAILAAREKEIQDFIPEPYWLVSADLQTLDSAATSFLGKYERGKKLTTKEEAEKLVNECSGKEAKIIDIKEKKTSEKPPKLFDLTWLQREAGNQFGFTAKRTLAVAQSLYENKKAITYPRTNSVYLVSDLAEHVSDYAKKIASPELKDAAKRLEDISPENFKEIFNDSKVADHHAIIPTLEDFDVSSFDESEKKLFDLIQRRTLAAFGEEAAALSTTITTEISGHKFHTSGKVYQKLGWRAVYSFSKKDDVILPELKTGDTVSNKKVAFEEKETSPPKRYSDASLLAAMQSAGKDLDDEELREQMKEAGIGTPATRAATIERLIEVEYIEREGKSFRVTPKGMLVVNLLSNDKKSSRLLSPELTGAWEKKLYEMEENEIKRSDFISSMKDFTKELLTGIETIKPPEDLVREAAKKETLGPCPHCGNPVVENKRGYSCWSKDDPGCGYTLWKRVSGKNLSKETIQELYKTGRTAEAVKDFRSKKGRNFDARLKVNYDKQAKKTTIVFDEDWAQEKPESKQT